MKFFLLAIIVLLNACTPQPPRPNRIPAGSGTLELSLNGFHNDLGQALIYIYPSAAGFPDDEAPDLIQYRRNILKGEARLVLENFPFGLYAISVLHDENRNNSMDRSILGLPTEGFGFSRNPDPFFGPPAYEKVRFFHVKKYQLQTIDIHYQSDRKKHRQKQKQFRQRSLYFSHRLSREVVKCRGCKAHAEKHAQAYLQSVEHVFRG